MANEENKEIVEVDELPTLPEIREGEEDTTDYKTLASQFASSAKRYKKLYDKEKLDKKVEAKVEKELEKKEVEKTDYGQMAFLETRGVPEEDYDFVLGEAKSTGKELREVLKFKYVQEELKNRKEVRETKNALPTSKRSSSAAHNEVDYWIAKGEMPKRDENPELYRKIRKERERLELSHQSSPQK